MADREEEVTCHHRICIFGNSISTGISQHAQAEISITQNRAAAKKKRNMCDVRPTPFGLFGRFRELISTRTHMIDAERQTTVLCGLVPFAIRIAYQPMMRRVAHTYCIDDDDDDHRAPLPLCLRVKSNFPKQMG